MAQSESARLQRWDVKRLAAGVVLAARSNSSGKTRDRNRVRCSTRCYPAFRKGDNGSPRGFSRGQCRGDTLRSGDVRKGVHRQHRLFLELARRRLRGDPSRARAVRPGGYRLPSEVTHGPDGNADGHLYFARARRRHRRAHESTLRGRTHRATGAEHSVERHRREPVRQRRLLYRRIWSPLSSLPNPAGRSFKVTGFPPRSMSIPPVVPKSEALRREQGHFALAWRSLPARLTSSGLTQRIAPQRPSPADRPSIEVTLIPCSASCLRLSASAPGRSSP